MKILIAAMTFTTLLTSSLASAYEPSQSEEILNDFLDSVILETQVNIKNKIQLNIKSQVEPHGIVLVTKPIDYVIANAKLNNSFAKEGE